MFILENLVASSGSVGGRELFPRDNYLKEVISKSPSQFPLLVNCGPDGGME